jgi:hypothetical protein
VALADTDLTDVEVTVPAEFGPHPHPIVWESIRFDLTYRAEHGARSFSTMVDEHLEKIEMLTSDGRCRFEAEIHTGRRDPYRRFNLDLNAIEAALRCDVGRRRPREQPTAGGGVSEAAGRGAARPLERREHKRQRWTRRAIRPEPAVPCRSDRRHRWDLPRRPHGPAAGATAPWLDAEPAPDRAHPLRWAGYTGRS